MHWEGELYLAIPLYMIANQTVLSPLKELSPMLSVCPK